MTLLSELGATSPVVAAPMAGGPTTPALVEAAARSGSLGFLAGGYLSAEALGEQLAVVAGETQQYGVNLFAPHPVRVDPAAYASYRDLLRPEADRLGVDLPAVPVDDDDDWQAKVEACWWLARSRSCRSRSVCPTRTPRLRCGSAGTVLLQTVTTVDEARRSAEAGSTRWSSRGPRPADTSAPSTPTRVPADRPLTSVVAEIVASVGLPVLAAGGVTTAREVVGSSRPGAAKVAVGTALLLADEAGTTAGPPRRTARPLADARP